MTLGDLCDNFGSDFIGCRFDGPPIAARLYLTTSAKRKRRKPPRSATDRALGRLQSNSTISTSMPDKGGLESKTSKKIYKLSPITFF